MIYAYVCLAFGAVCMLVLLADTVSPWPAFLAKRIFSRVFLGLDFDRACEAVAETSELREQLSAAEDAFEAFEEEFDATCDELERKASDAESREHMTEAKAQYFELALRSISESQQVPAAYLRELASKALREGPCARTVQLGFESEVSS